ncbi:hypothetical protein ACH4FX_41340 [Streptomyces sp. NPDC018019]|uniref:hypothetical protein n=1 Tax=Streptomyces sp. NPDC018019 TaxID=3365030 RepID=UPI0037B97E27
MTTGPEHTSPGLDLTIPLTATDAQALGDDAQLLAARLGEVLHGVALLRTGGADTDDLTTVIKATTDLLETVKGVRNAAVRQHAAQGGSYGALGRSMGVSRATAQSRRDPLLKKDPSAMEQWATGG